MGRSEITGEGAGLSDFLFSDSSIHLVVHRPGVGFERMIFQRSDWAGRHSPVARELEDIFRELARLEPALRKLWTQIHEPDEYRYRLASASSQQRQPHDADFSRRSYVKESREDSSMTTEGLTRDEQIESCPCDEADDDGQTDAADNHV